MTTPRLRADFNGLLGDLLCLSHEDYCRDENGNVLQLRAGMQVTVVEADYDEQGKRDDLIASGTVEPSPESLSCYGSKWALRIDANGVRNESEIDGPS